MNLSDFHFFDIHFYKLNLFSFMLGATWAFFNQGLFGKRIGLWIFTYFGGLAAWYAMLLYIANNGTPK
jgi:hypothetical protein